jgi:hypothetical protein
LNRKLGGFRRLSGRFEAKGKYNVLVGKVKETSKWEEASVDGRKTLNRT